MKATLTAEQAAQELAVSKKTLMRWARGGVLPAAKVGRLWFFAQKDVDDLLSPKNQLTRGRPIR